jgi:hypothetical protein
MRHVTEAVFSQGAGSYDDRNCASQQSRWLPLAAPERLLFPYRPDRPPPDAVGQSARTSLNDDLHKGSLTSANSPVQEHSYSINAH